MLSLMKVRSWKVLKCFIFCAILVSVQQSVKHIAHSILEPIDAFAMGKVHKDIAMFMMSSVEDSDKTDQSFIKVGKLQMYGCVMYSHVSVHSLLSSTR